MISQKVNGFERWLVFKPAFDHIDDPKKKQYGQHCMEIQFYLIGEKGAVHFILMSGMMKKKSLERMKIKGTLDILPIMQMGVDVGYHSPTPQFKGQEVRWPAKMKLKDPDMKDPGLDATKDERLAFINNYEWIKIGKKAPNCDLIGVPCYCDGSALRAEGWLEIFVSEGDDKIWEMLEEEYKDTFNV